MPVLKHYHRQLPRLRRCRRRPRRRGRRIVVNAKAQRPGVCNAVETLLVHRDAAPRFLPDGGQMPCKPEGSSFGVIPRPAPSSPRSDRGRRRDEDWDTEYLDLILTVGVVGLDRRGHRPHRSPRVGPHRGHLDPEPGRRPEGS